MTLSPFLRRLGLWGITALVMVVLPLLLRQGFALSMLSQMGIAVIFALSYNMLLGQTGMLSFGHAVYYGLGAYFSAHALNAIGAGKLGIPVTLLPLVGGVAGLSFGIVFGYVTTKRSGTPFAMISLGIAEMVAACALMFPGFFGGEGGIATNRQVGSAWLGITYGPQIQVYYLIAGWCLLSMIAMFALTHTPLGRMANAVRDNAERVRFVGYNPTRIRFMMLCLSTFFAGVAGGLGAINYELVTAENVGTVVSGNVLVMAFIGGVGHFFGPIIGAVLVSFLQSALSSYTQAWLLYFGLFFMVMVLFAPGGMASLIMIHAPVVRAKRMGTLALPYLVSGLLALVMLAGLVGLVEMIYFLETGAEVGKPLKLFGLALMPSTTGPWVGAMAVMLGGAAAFAWSLRLVRDAWARVHAYLQVQEGL